jgi:hypothetical protein
MLCCNGNSVTTINGGKYGSIYGGNGARIVVYGAEVDVIYGQGFINGKNQNWTQVGKDAKIKRLVAEVYCADIRVEDNAVVEVLDLTKVRKAYRDRIQVASTATVGKIVVGDKEYATYEEWYNSFA